MISYVLFVAQSFRRALFSLLGLERAPELAEQGVTFTPYRIGVICALALYIVGSLAMFTKHHLWDSLTPENQRIVVEAMVNAQQMM